MKIRIFSSCSRSKGGEEEVEAIRDVIESGWWGKGPKVSELEEKFAEMVGHKYAVALLVTLMAKIVNNGLQGY